MMLLTSSPFQPVFTAVGGDAWVLVLYSEMTSWAQLGWIGADVSAWLWLVEHPPGEPSLS